MTYGATSSDHIEVGMSSDCVPGTCPAPLRGLCGADCRQLCRRFPFSCLAATPWDGPEVSCPCSITAHTAKLMSERIDQRFLRAGSKTSPSVLICAIVIDMLFSVLRAQVWEKISWLQLKRVLTRWNSDEKPQNTEQASWFCFDLMPWLSCSV